MFFLKNVMYHHKETIKSIILTMSKQRKGILTHRQSELKKTPGRATEGQAKSNRMFSYFQVATVCCLKMGLNCLC